MATETQIAFEGTAKEQELAARAFEVMKRKGMLFGANSPIKMTVESIAQALTKEGAPLSGEDPQALASKLEATLRKNKAVFAPGDKGEYVTTKAGHAPHSGGSENTHTFKDRLNTGATTLDQEASKEYAASLVSRTANRAERSAVMDTSVIEIPVAPQLRPSMAPTPALRPNETQTIIPQHLIPHPPVVEEEEEEEEAPAPPRTQEPVAPAAHAPAAPPRRAEEATGVPARPTTPAVPSTPVAPVPPTTSPAPPTSATPTMPTPQPRVTAPTTPGEAPTISTRPATVEPTTSAPATPVVQQPAAQTPAAAPAPTPAPTPVKPAPAAPPATPTYTGPVEVILLTEDGAINVDLRRSVDEILEDDALVAALEAMIERGISSDQRLIRFGSDIFPEEAVERFSKGDFRRIKEYLDEPETGGVASDRDIMAEVLNRRTDHPDYERVRFSVNYRLLKEKKDFEFVGIDSDRLWINANASPVAPPARKPAEIGQDYRFLEDPAITSVEEEGDAAGDAAGPLQYSLTYYEYENGLLPYDRRFKRIFPGQVFEDQRFSLLRFEIPQLFGALLAELRYPTGNRGGFIVGLNELFNEHMVPGARFTITPTDRGEDVFEVHFTRNEEQEDNLLQYDDRRGRYVFRPTAYTVETDPTMLLTQEKFGKLHNHKKLDDAERKRPDVIIANAFEAVGDQSEGRFWAVFEDIYPVVNIERPISKSWLKTLLSGAYPFFYEDDTTEGAYFYDPSKRPS
ncbi:MAG TPA: hypothetical protein VGE45_18330 [Chloroflexia bacterium]|jgi:hypothetical protein